MRNWKEVLNHGLVLKKVHRVIKFNQNAWLNTDLKKAKNDFEKDFFKLMNNDVFDVYNRKKKELFSIKKQNYHTTKFFIENELAIKMKNQYLWINMPI